MEEQRIMKVSGKGNEELQARLELEMKLRGRDQYFATVRKAKERESESNTAPCISILKRGVAPLADALRNKMDELTSKGRAGRRHSAVRYLKDLDLDIVAFISLRIILDGISMSKILQNVAIRIGREIETEAKLQALAKFDAQRMEVTQNHLKKVHHRRRRKMVFDHAVRESQEFDWKAWPKSDLLHIGQFIIDVAIATSGLIQVEAREHRMISEGKGKNMFTTAYYLTATNECISWLEDRHERYALLSPKFFPTVIPPKPWTGAWGGGYHTDAVPALTLIKTTNKNYLNEIDELIKAGEMTEVVDAINTMQNTAWRINKPVLKVMQAVFEMQDYQSLAGLPARELTPIPRCPACGADMSEVTRMNPHSCPGFTEEKLLEWKKASVNVRTFNAGLVSKQLQFRRMLDMAIMFEDAEAIYFPYQLDFRGRVYSVPSHLTPQGTDASKGLLEFAEGKALGSEDAVRWLAIHGANTWGNDKVSFEARHQWVLDNQDMILACAEDPLGETWWMDADSPFCFLAFCFEWAGYVRDGLNHVSHIPIAMDGSCNGLQIFSLMLRDEEGGRAVNVLPSEKPQDIYGIVAERAIEKLKVKLESGEKVYSKSKKDENGKPKFLYDEKVEAKKWLDMGVTRKTTKRQVMVLPYGGTQQSCREYTHEHLRERIMDGYQWEGNEFMSSLFMSTIIWEAINEVVRAAQDAMKYLQRIADIVSSAGLPVWWTTPTGLPVLQAYKEIKNRRIETKMGDCIVFLTMKEEVDEKYDKAKQRNGISPNFIHSLDAAALQRTVCEAAKLGINSYAMIHDSYGTHAADTPALARTLREVFAGMFGGDHNLLEEFTKEVIKVLPDDDPRLQELPELPQMGNMEVSKVKEAAYFFA